MEALLRTNQLCRRFGAVDAVQGVDLELFPGEIVALLGPNGAGKSTTLRMLCGCLTPSSGTVTINGLDLQRSPFAAKRAIGYLPETPPLYRDLRVDEYLNFCARLRGVGTDQLREKRERVKSLCGLGDCGRRLIGNLSKGYQQRVGIAQALIHDPQLIILDEPSSGLDPNQIVEIRALIRSLGANHSIILSSHILAEAESVCDRVLIMHRGSVVFSEPLGRLSEPDQQTLTVVLGTPPQRETLAALPGVAAADALGSGRFELRLEAGCSSGQLARELALRDWELRELSSGKSSLEQVFTRLTTVDRSAAGA
ncbi:MAG: ATP-binding cassette domain-containing protein [Gammaproteobacteria bacterium]|nr:ATP-binding cassette domain-containing protein [Gammaproteobacteria bacterium]